MLTLTYSVPTTLPFSPANGQRSKRQLMSFKLSTVVKFNLSTPQLINLILVNQSPTDAATQFLSKLFPSFFKQGLIG